MTEDENTVDEELDEFVDDIEMEDELHHEEKIRKKNAKVFLISIIGVLTIAGVYFGINYYNISDEEEQLVNQVESPQTDLAGIETLSLGKDIKKIEKKAGLSPKDELKKMEEMETLQKIKKVAPAKKQIKGKDSKSTPQVSKDLKNSFVEKKLTSQSPSSQKTAKRLSPETDKTGKYYIQLGMFVIKRNADNLIRSLKNKGFSPSKRPAKEMVKMYRVFAGKFSELKIAREAIVELKNAGITATLKKVTDRLYTLHTGSFYIKRNAEKLKEKISEQGLIPTTIRAPLLVDVYKVYIGYFKTKKDAVSYKEKLAGQGFSQTLILNT